MKPAVALIVLVAAAALAAAPDLAAQEPPGERVLIRTVDEAELAGRFYRSPRKKPCVLLLHGPGNNRSARVWRPLAERLHEEGYAVLSFDFRGHGQSTTVDPDLFWMQAANRNGIRGAQDEVIDADRFSDRYWPVLINDIAAAKAFLDRKNDAGECNSANLILIGANEGAALGAAWLHAECYRYRQHPPPFFGAPAQLEATPQAQHVLCALWLNLETKLGSRSLNLAGLLDGPIRRQRIPVVLVCDRDSAVHQRAADGLERTVKQSRARYSGIVSIAAGGIERGEDLLVRHYPPEQIVEYLKEVGEDLGDEWQDFDSRQSLFVWRTPRLLTPANRIGSNTLLFQTYESFVGP